MTRHLTTLEIAERLRMSPDRVRILARAGVIPARRACPRGRLLFVEAEVEAALRRAGRAAGAKAAGPITAA
jgi:excisionase family DNA binding protein